MNEPIPVLNRFFRVEIQDLNSEGPPEAFYSVKGLNVSTTYITEHYLPGGYEEPFRLPVASRTGTLVLKRPLLRQKTSITTWCEEVLKTLSYQPTVAQIFIMDQSGENIITQWSAEGVYPVSLEHSALGVEQGNGIVEEIITLAYLSLTRA